MSSEQKRSLAEKISIMQVAQAGGKVYVKTEMSDKYVKVDEPAWNWGISDYQIIDDISTVTSNAASASLNYPSLVQKLNWLERGKKLENINTYATKVLNSAKNAINEDLDTNLSIDMSGINVSTIGDTTFYNRLLAASDNNTDLVNSCLAELTEQIKPIIRKKLLANIKNLLSRSIQNESNRLPNEESLYTNTAPTEQDIRNTVQNLADRISADYPTAPDKSIIEYTENNITAVFLKDVSSGNVITLSYDLEKATIAENGGTYQVAEKIDDVEKKYTVVTIDELDNKANELLTRIELLRTDVLKEAESLVNTKVKEEHDAITAETADLINSAIDEYNSQNEAAIVAKAETTTNNLFNNLSKNFAEAQAQFGIYATEETKTNKMWIDGKPIYRKVLVLTDPPVNWTPIDLSAYISNSDCLFDGNYIRATRATGQIICSKYYVGNDDRLDYLFAQHTNNLDHALFITSSHAYSEIEIAVEYTKATDS